VHAGNLATLRAEPTASEFLAGFDDFMRRFGHLSDSAVNLSSPTWAEHPEHVLKMLAVQLDGAGAARARPSCDEYVSTHELTRSQERSLRRAVAYQSYRDRTSALYTYSYAQFRPHLLALARHLEVMGALDERDDVFYLTIEEIERVVRGVMSPSDARALVAERAEEVRIASEGEPPEIVVGEVAELVRMPQRRILRGTPSSRGRYAGRVVVCQGIGDLERIQKGDVVVVPFSDASWTPLFTRAGAIVAESGGVLSHSAILARELGLPAVVSVRGALALTDGSLVNVDGFEGTVTVISAAS
jgi:pyruvate,water dikinase